MIILTPSKKFPSQLKLQIITNEDIGLNFNKHNILFLIQDLDEETKIGIHFKTFKLPLLLLEFYIIIRYSLMLFKV